MKRPSWTITRLVLLAVAVGFVAFWISPHRADAITHGIEVGR